jgi:hypothetical protein
MKATKEKLTRKAKLSEEDSTDVDVSRSDSLAVNSYRDINVFTYRKHSVRKSAAMRQCVCGNAAVRVRQCGSVRHCCSVWQYARLGAVECGMQYVVVRTAVCTSNVYTSCSPFILLVLPFIPRISINTNYN